MKIISFFSLCALMLVSPVHSHGTDVQHCVTAEGKLRIFVAHWHGGGISTSSAGSMTIQQNHLDGQPSITLNPTGSIANITTSSLPGCERIATRASMCSGRSDNDWVWYDFPTTCNIPVNYTIISGNTVYLEEACSRGFTPQPFRERFRDLLRCHLICLPTCLPICRRLSLLLVSAKARPASKRRREARPPVVKEDIKKEEKSRTLRLKRWWRVRSIQIVYRWQVDFFLLE